MKIKFGVAHTNRVVEINCQDTEQIRSAIEQAFAQGRPILWLEDADGTHIGIPIAMLAFVEFESPENPSGVGFAAGG